MCCEKLTCAICCSIFSGIGCVFLLILGALLKAEPFYLHGVDDPDSASSGCFVSAGLYVATGIISLVVWSMEARKAKEQQRRDTIAGVELERIKENFD